MCGGSPTREVFCNTSCTTYNLTQFGHCLPGDASDPTDSGFSPTDCRHHTLEANRKSRWSPVPLACKSEVLMTSSLVLIDLIELLTELKKKKTVWTSGQDGGTCRHTVPPHKTKRRTTTNLKRKNNQNCQKIELYGSPTTKELKKKHSSRLVGGMEAGSRAERTRGKAAAGGPGEGAAGGFGGPTFLCGQTRRNNWGVRQTVQPE